MSRVDPLRAQLVDQLGAPDARPMSTESRSGRLRDVLRDVWHNCGLSIVLMALFFATFAGQALSGWLAYNDEQTQHGETAITLANYLLSGHFGEATFENWESEFLQMAFYVLLTTWLFQKGSSESKRPNVHELVDVDPRIVSSEDVPWPVRRRGVCLVLYENSLSLTFAFLFLSSFAMHARTGLVAFNEQQLEHGSEAVTLGAYMQSSQFWFESFQNWQSEFLSLAAMVILSIFLRQRGSPESKPVHAPVWETGA